MTKEQIEARMEVYEEALGHLELVYMLSDSDPLEREQSTVLVDLLRKQSKRWYNREISRLEK